MRPNAPNPLEETDFSGLSQSIDHTDLLPSLIDEVRRQVLDAEEADRLAAEEADARAKAAQAESGAIALEEEVAVAVDAAPPPVHEPAPVAEELDEDIIPLEPEDTTDDTALKTCPVCFHRYPPIVQTCANCGFDERVGIQSSRFIEASRTPPKGHAGQHKPYACPHCGYDMTGAVSLQCPECGGIMPTRAQVMREELSKQTAQEAYHTPAVYLAVGLLGALIVGLVQSGWPVLVVLPTVFAVQVAVGMLVLYACMFFWIGFDAPFNLNLLRLSAAYALTLFAALLLGAIPFVPFVGALIPWFIFIGLAMQLFEYDFVDAAAVVIGTMLVSIAGFMVLPGLLAMFQ